MSIVCCINGFVVAADHADPLEISFSDSSPQTRTFYEGPFIARYRLSGSKRYNKIEMQGSDDVAFFITFIRGIHNIPDNINIGLKLAGKSGRWLAENELLGSLDVQNPKTKTRFVFKRRLQ